MECGDCGCSVLLDDYERGDLVCSACGLVIEAGARERNAFLSASAPVSVRDAAEVVCGPLGGKRGRGIRGGGPSVRAVAEAQINDMCEAAGIASVAPLSKSILRTAFGSRMYKNRKGANARGYLVAVIFHACKISGAPRTPKELCSVLGAELSAMRRMVKETQAAADSHSLGRGYSFSAPDPVSIIHRFLYKLDMTEENRALLKKCASELWSLYSHRLATYERDSIIAAMIFFMYGMNKDYIDEIAEVCCVCKNTVKGVSSKIDKWQGEEQVSLL